MKTVAVKKRVVQASRRASGNRESESKVPAEQALAETSRSDARLYEQVAERILQLIEGGTLRPGQRVPSVRELSTQQGVSVSTVLQSYRKLENAGWIEARPQSGYYVRQSHQSLPPEPEATQPPFQATSVSISELVMQVMQSSSRSGMIQLGAATLCPDMMPTRQLYRAMAAVTRRTPHLAVAYDIPPGCEALRVQIARRSMNAGCTLTPDDLVITCGCQEALNLCLRAVAKPGDTILLESPTYYGVLQIIESLGMCALELPTHPRDGINLDALEYALEQKEVTACLLSPNFTNPLGSCMPDENKERLVQILERHNIPLIEDDIYGDIAFAPRRPKTAKAFDRSGNVLMCSSFSKTLAPGYRIGWVAPGRYQKQIEYLKVMNTLASASLPSLTVAEFLANGSYDHHLRRITRWYRDRVQCALHGIEQYFPEGTRVTRPAGGYVVWVQLPDGVDALDLFRRALAENISIAPGHIFSAKPKYSNFIRLNCGYHEPPTMESALQKLGQIVHSML
jgi:DNA-binding transcriptional MocR family regulator